MGSQVSGVRFLEVGGDELAMAEVPELPSHPFLGQKDYIIQGFATLVAAYPKGGKTETMVATLPEWLNRGLRVLYFTEESQLIWQARLKENPELWGGVRFVFALGAQPQDLLARMASGDEEIVMIDTLRSCLQFSNEVDNSEVARAVSPWIATAREKNKTLIGLHHETKAGGEHGRGIAGGHALFGIFDAALEISRVPNLDNRRLIRVYARLISPPELLYERREDGSFEVLGELRAVEREEVKRRVKAVLTDEWMKTKEVQALLDEPRPGLELLRQALSGLFAAGEVERDPAEDRKGATYRWRTLLPTAPPIGGKSGSEEEKAGATAVREADIHSSATSTYIRTNESEATESNSAAVPDGAVALVQKQFEADVAG